MSGPERPAIIERFVQLIPLRYPLAALAWEVILNPVGFGIADYIQNGASPFSFPNPFNALFGLLLSYYLFYVVRSLRLRILGAEPQVTPIIAGGEAEYHSLFGRLTSTRHILALGVVLDALAILVTSSNLSFSLLSIYNLFTQAILLFSFACLIWEYMIASWGLHKLGRTQLRLKSFLEDRFLGARSIGNVALSLTVAYLVGLLLFFLDSATFLPVLTPAFAAFFLFWLAIGIVMFFLPLNSIHSRMQSQKAEYQQELGEQLLGLKLGTQAQSSNGPASLEKVDAGIGELVRIKNLEIRERKLAATATWPFDAQLLARLIAIILSITAVLLSRIITDLLKI